MKKATLLCISIFFCFSLNAKDKSLVNITTTGQAETVELAINIALRSAIEQSFGVFISSKTEIINDELTTDRISSTAKGVVNKYKVLNKTEISDNKWSVALEVLLSIDKLAKFSESKGMEIEVSGDVYARNILLQELSSKSEVIAMLDMLSVAHELMQNSFDFKLSSSSPKKDDSQWNVFIDVEATANKNIERVTEYITTVLEALAMTDEEKKLYRELEMPKYEIILNKKTILYLRTKESVFVMESFISNLEFYMSNFILGTNGSYNLTLEDSKYNQKKFGVSFVDRYGKKWVQKNGYAASFNYMDNLKSWEKVYGLFDRNYAYDHLDYWSFYSKNLNYKTIEKWGTYSSSGLDKYIFSLPDAKELCATYKLCFIYDTHELKSLKGYNIKPKGVVSEFVSDGYLIHTQNGDFVYSIHKEFNNQQFFEKDNWVMPTEDDCILILKEIYNKRIGVSSDKKYSTRSNTYSQTLNFYEDKISSARWYYFKQINHENNFEGRHIKWLR